MKIRSLRPAFFADTKMAQLTPYARILYMGLWCIADDEGRGRYLPKQIEGEVFPHEQVDIRGFLGELITAGRIVVYEAGGEPYFHIPTFLTHLTVNRRFPSQLPAPAVSTHNGSSAQAPSVEVEVEVEVDTGRKPTQDGLWTALEELFGPVTESHRSRRGKIVKGLRALDAAPEDIKRRAEAWPALFAGSKLTLTDTALEKFWGNLGLLVAAETKVRPDCDICRNRWQVGVTKENYTVAWDDEDAVTWKPCRCVKGATK